MDSPKANFNNNDAVELEIGQSLIDDFNNDLKVNQQTTPAVDREADDIGSIGNKMEETGKTFVSLTIDKLQNNSVCIVCKKQFKETNNLSCLHILCSECLDIEKKSLIELDNLIFNDMAGNCSNANYNTDRSLSRTGCPICQITKNTVDSPSDLLNAKTDYFLNTMTEQSDTQTSSSSFLRCGFCSEEETTPAVYACADCNENMCQLCSDSHKRQKKTKKHKVLRMTNTTSNNNFLNSESEREADDYVMFSVSQLQHVLREAKCCMRNVKTYMDSIQQSREIIHNSAKDTEDEICEFIYDFTQALERHKQILLDQIQQIKKEKEKRLELQENHLSRLHSDLENSCNIVGDMLTYRTTEDVSDVQDMVVDKLNKLMDFSKKACEPQNTTMVFSPESRGNVIGNFQMYGKVLGSVVRPEKCRLSGQGIETVRVGQSFTVTLETRDADDRQFKDGVRVEAWVTSVTDSRNRAVSVKKTRGGHYLLTFDPTLHGPHFLHVLVNGLPIHGNPFKFMVRSALREHSGVWQFGTTQFPSNTGRHENGLFGHSGTPHWSCCGKTTRTSECHLSHGTSSQSLIREFTL